MRGLDPRARLFLGVVTTVVFFGLGSSMYMGGSTIGGGALIGLGIFRGWAWVRELRLYMEPDDEE